jgi:5-methyltetrahydropteroyltriglutamate--homocysteine methyltransferase
MSRKILSKLGINLPFLPATTVGSLPKPDYLLEARRKYARKDIDYLQLNELEIKATKFWVNKQNEIGLDVLVDGEMYRGDMVAFFAENLNGFETGELVRSYGNRYYRKPVITGEVKWDRPITVDWWRYAQSLTGKPVKAILTGAYTIMDWSFNEYYATRRDAGIAIAWELRKEVESLIDAGARIIQIDEPAMSTRIDELDVANEVMDIVTDGFDAYFIAHVCYGNFAPVYQYMLSLNIDNLDLETSCRPQILEDYLVINPFDKDISYGVIDVHNHITEGILEIAETINQALNLFPKDTIWIDPDCGLKTRSVNQAVDKLANMTMAVSQIRKVI